MIEEKTNKKEEWKAGKYLYISPRLIRFGATLVDSHETLELYENMEQNTINFADQIITNIIAAAEKSKAEVRSLLTFHLIFCGRKEDIAKNTGNSIDFIMQNCDRIVAVYKLEAGNKQEADMAKLDKQQKKNKSQYIYLNLKQFFQKLSENHIHYEIEKKDSRYVPTIYRLDASTKLLIQYSPVKDYENDKGYQLIRR